MIYKKIYFFSSGSKISAILNLPDNNSKKKLPCVIFAHGYTSYKDEFGGFIKLAEMFCNEGFAVLRFDFRGCGESTDINEKGKMLCATEWPEDIYNAVIFVSNLSSINPKMISILGVSMGGAAVLSALRFIENIKSVVVLCPVSNGHLWLKNLWIKKGEVESWKKFYKVVIKERKNRILKNVDNFIDVVDVLAYPDSELKVFKELVINYPQMSSRASYSSVEDIVFKLDTPSYLKLYANKKILFVHGTGDTAVPLRGTEEMYRDYRGEKELILLKGRPHGLVLEKDCETYLEGVIKWIKEH